MFSVSPFAVTAVRWGVVFVDSGHAEHRLVSLVVAVWGGGPAERSIPDGRVCGVGGCGGSFPPTATAHQPTDCKEFHAMATHDDVFTAFGLTKPEGERLVTRLIQATVPPERMRNDELLNLADSIRVINDRLPGLLQRHPLLQTFWDRIETEITSRLLDDLRPTRSQIDGQTTLDTVNPSTGVVAS